MDSREDKNAIFHARVNISVLTRASCTAPQKQVAVASSSVDQPLSERLTIGNMLLASKVFMASVALRLLSR